MRGSPYHDLSSFSGGMVAVVARVGRLYIGGIGNRQVADAESKTSQYRTVRSRVFLTLWGW